MRVDLFIQDLRLDKQLRSVRRSAEQVPTASDGCDLRLPRVTAVSQTPGTARKQEDTQGHDGAANQVQEDTGGAAGMQKDTTPRRFGTVRPRVQIPGPRPKSSGGFNRSRQHWPTGTRQRVDAARLDWAGASPEFCEGGGSSELRRRLGSWARIG